MKIYYIGVLKPVGSSKAVELVCKKDLSSFGYFERGTVNEFMTFFAKTVVSRTQPNQRQSIEQLPYVGHVFSSPDGIAGILLTDKEYPVRPAYTLINMVLDDFVKAYPASKWSSISSDPSSGQFDFPALESYIKRYQDPSQADALMRVQKELDDTKIVLHKTVDNLLKRGENLDSLVKKSEDLSSTSKVLFARAKETNSSCCVIM